MGEETTRVSRSCAPAILAALLASYLCLVAPALAMEGAARCPHRHWVGAWGAPPTDAGGDGLDHQTIRMVVMPQVGGEFLRVRFSGLFGTAPIKLTDVRIGKRGPGASILPGSNRRLTWDGTPSVTLEPGENVASDTARLRFKPFEPLSISAYVAGHPSAITRHYIAEQTSYLTAPGAGDHSADTGGRAFTSSTTSWLLVDGVDVSTRRRLGAVVAFGDSLTDGFNSGLDANNRYPDFLARRLLQRRQGAKLSVLNAGISGNGLVFSFPPYGLEGVNRAQADVVDQPGAADVLLLEGSNDLKILPADYVITALQTLFGQFRSNGLHTILGTLPPMAGSSEINTQRLRVNKWIRGHPEANVVDFDRVLRDPQDPSRLAPRYDSGDHLHPNAAGYRAMAAEVRLSQLHGAGCP